MIKDTQKPHRPIPEPSGMASRRASLDILSLVGKGRSLDDALASCRTFDALIGPDRGFARALATTVLRRRGTLDHIIGPYLDRPLPARAARVMEILRLAGAQILLMEIPAHAAVSTSVTLCADRQETGGYGGLVNAISRKLVKSGPVALAKLPARVDTPGWMWRAWERAYGPAKARAIAAANAVEPSLDLTLKKGEDATDWAAKFAAADIPAKVLGTGSLRLKGASDITALPGFDDGAWWVQDAAAALPVRLLGDVAGKHIYDLCAAPGGKTLQLASAGARVIAVDKSGDRQKRVQENLKRIGLTAETITEDILRWKPADKADAILLDAPCSATGTIRRHPDILWSKSQDDVDGLTQLQSEMIDHAVRFLKPEGVIIYCTCSLQSEENERQIDAALKRHTQLSRVPITPDALPGLPEAVTSKGDMRTFPSMLKEEGGLDGFFAARLIKTS